MCGANAQLKQPQCAGLYYETRSKLFNETSITPRAYPPHKGPDNRQDQSAQLTLPCSTTGRFA